MKKLTYLFLALIFLASCGGTKKAQQSEEPKVIESSVPEVKKEEAVKVDAPIKEVEEKVVKVDEKAADPNSYNVIIGSFRIPENARTYQQQIAKDGFASVILRNEAGLYRVSVMSTEDINRARENIMTIRRDFPQYFDTWLLIQKK